MRIAFVVSEFPAVSETFVLNQIVGLVQLGHEVDVHARFRGRTGDPVVALYGLDRRTYTGRMPWSYYLRVLRAPAVLRRHRSQHRPTLLRALDPFRFGADALSMRLFYAAGPFLDRSYDVVHCHFGENGNLIAEMKALGAVRAPLLTTFHGYGLRMAARKGRGLYDALRRHGDLVVAISKYSRRRLVELGFHPDRIIDHAMGIDLEQFPFRPRRRLAPTKDDSVRLLSVGRLAVEKGHDIGIRAVHQLLQRNPRWAIRYTVVGDGPLRQPLHRLVEELGLSDHVRFTGALGRDGVTAALREADIFVLPSRAEVLPMVLMEAQATGVPVVATDVGAVSELVEDGVTGYTVPPESPSLLAERLGRLIAEAADHTEMTRRGRAVVEERHDIRILNPRLARILEGLANGESAAALHREML